MDRSQSIIESRVTNLSYDKNGRKQVNQYLFLSTIGKGSYAKVKLCLNTENNKKYAVKIINITILKKKKKGMSRDSEGNMKFIYMIEDALHEIKILKILNSDGGHNNVIKLFEILNDDQKEKIYLILEYCLHGSILDYNDRKGIFSINKFYKGLEYSEEDLKKFTCDIIQGLQYLHSKGIIHRDIKTDNILIDEYGNCKLSDFNIASIIENEDKFSKTEGNFYFYPPEFCNGKPVDVWAVGVTIYVCTFLKLPFLPSVQSNMLELFKIIEKAEVEFPDISRKNKISDKFKGLLLKMLEKDPNNRIKCNEIIEELSN